MIVLLAESKTMSASLDEVSVKDFSEHRPVFEDVAESVAVSLSGYNVTDLGERLGLGVKSSHDAFRFFHDFSDTSHGLKAIDAYTGVVFRHLDHLSLDKSRSEFLNDCFLIISSLYGVLRPCDIVRPYRLDFNSKVMPDGMSPMRYWPSYVTDCIRDYMNEKGETHILNLLPKYAAACVDIKSLSGDFDIRSVSFKIQRGTSRITPHAGLLKALRGTLAREIVEKGVTEPDLLMNTDVEFSGFMYDPDLSSPCEIAFVTA